jgi:hypothetical protein
VRGAISNDRPYRDLTEQCGHKTFQISGFWADYGQSGNNLCKMALSTRLNAVILVLPGRFFVPGPERL